MFVGDQLYPWNTRDLPHVLVDHIGKALTHSFPVPWQKSVIPRNMEVKACRAISTPRTP